MISTDAYTAFLVDGATEHAIELIGGNTTFDVGRWPFIQSTLRVTADAAVLAELDPRAGVRIRTTATATDTTTKTRTFDLGVRSSSRSQRTGEATVELASDEALLADYRPGADDVTPLTLQASLRNIIDYVLGKAIPGAELEAAPAHDANLTTYTDAENAFKDPRALGAFFGAGCTVASDAVWPGNIDGVPHKSVWLHTPTSKDSYAYMLGTGSMNGTREGETWVASATGRVHLLQSGSIDVRARRLAVYIDVGGYVEFLSAAVPAPVGSEARVSVEFTVPTGAREVFVRAYHGATAGEFKWSQFRFTKKSAAPGVDDAAYFWGGKPDTPTYDYSYVGDPDKSASKRRAVIDRRPELLVWKAGQSAMDFLLPLFQSAGLRLVCDEQRRWTLRDEHYQQDGALAVRYGVNLREGDDKLARDADWFDGAVVRWRWRDYDGVQQERVDAYVPAGASRVTELVMERAYPGPGYAEYITRRALQRGREVTVTSGADWAATAEQTIQIVLDGAPLQIGSVQVLRYDLDNNEMTITTRATDIPDGAIDLLPGTIDALAGTIDSL